MAWRCAPSRARAAAVSASDDRTQRNGDGDAGHVLEVPVERRRDGDAGGTAQDDAFPAALHFEDVESCVGRDLLDDEVSGLARHHPLDERRSGADGVDGWPRRGLGGGCGPGEDRQKKQDP